MSARFRVDVPLDPVLVTLFDSYFDFLLAYGHNMSEKDSNLYEALLRVGVLLVRDGALVRLIIDSLNDVKHHGDILAALDVLYDQGIVDLAPAVVAQLPATSSGDFRF